MMMKIANFLKNLKKDEKGFTLIELMVVIAVLGILAALIIPQFSNVSDKALKANAASTAQAIATAASMYYNENHTDPNNNDFTTKLQPYMNNISQISADYSVNFDSTSGTVYVKAKDKSGNVVDSTESVAHYK